MIRKSTRRSRSSDSVRVFKVSLSLSLVDMSASVCAHAGTGRRLFVAADTENSETNGEMMSWVHLHVYSFSLWHISQRAAVHVLVLQGSCSPENAAQWGGWEKRGGEDVELLGMNPLTKALIAKACLPLMICINTYSVIRPCTCRSAAISENILL